MPAVHLYYSPSYDAAGCDFDTTRKAGWIADSLEDHPIPNVELVEPEPLSVEQLMQVHDPAYVEAVQRGQPRELAESNGLTWDPGLWKAALSCNGGVVAATLRALRTGTHAGSLSSGLHHACRDHGAGFCTFNGIAVAVREAMKAGARNVLVVDLDAHCGGGTYSMIRDWPGVTVLDIAVSDGDSYRPDKAGPSTLDIIGNADHYLPTLRRRLEALSGSYFDVLLYGAGMDPHESSMGGLAGVTFELLAERERVVFGWANARTLPVGFTLLGGYSSERLMRADLVGLHRLTIAAAAQASAGSRYPS